MSTAMDWLMRSCPRAALSVFVGDGHGSVVSERDFGAEAGRGLTPADVNGDGKLDFVAANQFANLVSVFLNRGGVDVGSLVSMCQSRPHRLESR